MPYILNKYDGTILTTVNDASIDQTTDLTFVGRNYAGYGEYQNENFLKLLENFAGISEPGKPLEGQCWYDKNTGKISLYDGRSWKKVANLEVSLSDPIATKDFQIGDMWYNSSEQQLFSYNGTSFSLIGPPSGADSQAQWRGSYEYDVTEGTSVKKYNAKAIIGGSNDVIAIISNDTYTVLDPGTDSYPVSPQTTKIYKGITLAGADAVTGISGTTSTGVVMWGTSAHALRADIATAALGSTGVVVEDYATGYSPPTPVAFPLTFALSVGATSLAVDTAGATFNPVTNTIAAATFQGTATSAFYADLAERYEADNEYESGTVVILGGSKEITTSQIEGDVAVLGVVSTKPAYLMNSGAGNNITHPCIALKGRVPCKVIGPINKGDLLVTSSTPGYARSKTSDHSSNAVFAKSISSTSNELDIIEVVII